MATDSKNSTTPSAKIMPITLVALGKPLCELDVGDRVRIDRRITLAQWENDRRFRRVNNYDYDLPEFDTFAKFVSAEYERYGQIEEVSIAPSGHKDHFVVNDIAYDASTGKQDRCGPWRILPVNMPNIVVLERKLRSVEEALERLSSLICKNPESAEESEGTAKHIKRSIEETEARITAAYNAALRTTPTVDNIQAFGISDEIRAALKLAGGKPITVAVAYDGRAWPAAELNDPLNPEINWFVTGRIIAGDLTEAWENTAIEVTAAAAKPH